MDFTISSSFQGLTTITSSASTESQQLDLQLCKQEKLRYCLDEGFLIVGKDIAQDESIKRNESLYYHPQYGGTNDRNVDQPPGKKKHYNVTYFADNGRLIH